MLISICMATYNGGKYIREQMDSILAQDLSLWPDAEMEIIVSDDGSTDDNIKLLESYNNPRIKIFHHTNNGKKHKYYNALYRATANFSYAMQKAKGDYIFLSDQDDVWLPNKVAVALEALTRWGG